MASAREFGKLLLSSGAVLLRPDKPFRFASGIRSPIYCDNRLLLSDVTGRRMVIQALCTRASALKTDHVAGTATAGIPWGAWVAEELNAPFLYVRGKAKEHGRGNQIEGRLEPGRRVCLVEDLVSTGGSVLASAEALAGGGAVVAGILCIFSYGFSDTRLLFARHGWPLETLLTLEDLLPVAVEEGTLTSEQAQAVRRWSENPKTWSG